MLLEVGASQETHLGAAFPEVLGRTVIACLEPLLGKCCFEGGVQIPVQCVCGGPIRIIHVLL